MPADTNQLEAFRQALYLLFPKRSDAVFNLLDALSSSGHHCKSVVELSESKHCPRKYSSITDAIADGLSSADWAKVTQTIWSHVNEITPQQPYHKFVMDGTPNPRPYAHAVSDRSIVHKANPTPGNKPICVGHQYSVLAYIPPGISKARKNWIVPLDARRIKSDEKGHEVGMTQMSSCIVNLGIENELSLSVADSAYATEFCRKEAGKHNNHVQVVRLRSSRVVYTEPEQSQSTEPKRGRKKRYGKKHSLAQLAEGTGPDQERSLNFVTRGGKELTVKIMLWDGVMLRGSKEYKGYENPFSLVRCAVENENNDAVFKKPLWLIVTGKRRAEIDLADIFFHYADRFDIEHFFKFGKRNLLMDKYQSPSTEHEESWWRLACLAYVQLFLAKKAADCTPKLWERYLASFKDKPGEVLSPSFTQRGLHKVLEQIGTPAVQPKSRGKPLGRKAGETIKKRETHPVIFKSKKSFLPGSGKKGKKPKPQKNSNELVNEIYDLVKKFNLTLDQVKKAFLAFA